MFVPGGNQTQNVPQTDTAITKKAMKLVRTERHLDYYYIVCCSVKQFSIQITHKLGSGLLCYESN